MKNFAKNYSTEQATRIIGSAFIIFGFFGFAPEISAESLSTSIGDVLLGVSLIVVFAVNVYGYFRRYFKGDVTLGGFRTDVDN